MAADDAKDPTAPTPGSGDVAMSGRQQEAAQVFIVAYDHHRHGRLDEAVRGYTKALVLNPAYGEAYANLEQILKQGKDMVDTVLDVVGENDRQVRS